MKVVTRVGEIECPEPDQVPEKVRYWAEALVDLARTDELYAVLGAALFEAYHAGQAVAAMNFLGAVRQEIIDVEGNQLTNPWKQAVKNLRLTDPALRSQMGQVMEADPLNHPLRLQMYLDACQKATGASESTRRKWRKALGL